MEQNEIFNRNISSKTAKEKMEQKEKLTILDVRTKREYDQGHIPNAILLPLGEIEQKANEILCHKEEVILVYCRSGVRSKQAINLLVKLGYTNVYDLGGILNWPYEIEK